jgi:uncharacterized protein YjbI with pentapeptide repeats
MADEKQLALLRSGPAAWNAWRLASPTVRPDLLDTDLRGANLRQANPHAAQLTGATLWEAVLMGRIWPGHSSCART